MKKSVAEGINRIKHQNNLQRPNDRRRPNANSASK